jgi:Domain of unknown function (DUF4412)
VFASARRAKKVRDQNFEKKQNFVTFVSFCLIWPVGWRNTATSIRANSCSFVVNIPAVLKSTIALSFSVLFCLVVSPSLAADTNNSFEGTISATLARAGTEATHFVFTRKGSLLRIENTTNKLEPVNIVDLDGKKLTIIYPHNTTFVHVDLAKVSAQPGAPPLPPNFPAPPKSVEETDNASPARTFPGTTTSSPTNRIGPNISPPPGFPSPPPMPSVPQMPNPASAGPPMSMPQMPNNPGAPGIGMGMPPMPMPMPGMVGPGELKKTDKTKKIQGFECALYTVSERGENFEIWATSDAAMFPFQLIKRDFLGRRFGPQMLEETWPELLSSKSLFPLEVTLKMEPGGQERLSFKIDKIDKKKIDDTKLFEPPEKYIEIQAPQF